MLMITRQEPIKRVLKEREPVLKEWYSDSHQDIKVKRSKAFKGSNIGAFNHNYMNRSVVITQQQSRTLLNKPKFLYN